MFKYEARVRVVYFFKLGIHFPADNAAVTYLLKFDFTVLACIGTHLTTHTHIQRNRILH